MAKSTTLKLRELWLQVHKWIGLILAILIIPISLTGSLLVWHDGLDSLVNPQRYAVTGDAVLAPSRYVAAAQAQAEAGERVASVRMPEHDGPVIVSLAPGDGGAQRAGPPQRRNLYLDPPTANVLDASVSTTGLIRFLHVLHGSLQVPGWGRQLVGWVGVFMFISCLTGIWLWWPVTGSLKSGFRWKRQQGTNANLHHLLGFWILVPLAMLSFTGFWISFPQFFGSLIGAQQQGGGGGGGRPPARVPMAQPALGVDEALALAQAQSGGGALIVANVPNEGAPQWSFQFEREGGNAEVKVDDTNRQLTPPPPPRPETFARMMRRWHDGGGMGWGWQFLIFLGGIIPCILSITGIVMWWNARKWRRALAKRQAAVAAKKAEAVAAE